MAYTSEMIEIPNIARHCSLTEHKTPFYVYKKSHDLYEETTIVISLLADPFSKYICVELFKGMLKAGDLNM